MSCVSKVFTKILNNRLTNWAEDNDKMYEVQGGFTKGKITIDQIFVFQSLVSKYLSKKRGRFYTVFVDFAKAFDSVPHLHLFYSLIQEGLHGRTICLLQDMYQKLNSCIQTSSGCITESFPCSKGTRQGCMLSPLMFIFYINELIKQSEANQCKGIYVDEKHQNVSMLLYADDVVLMADNIGHLQHSLDNLASFCNKWGLTVNMEKTNFMAFRNGGIVKKNERVYLNGENVKSTPYYKYLGIVMSTRLSWSPAQKTLAEQAEKSINCIRRLNFDCDFSFSTGKEIFDKCTLPVITYGSEIWGSSVNSSIENVMIKYCRMQLGVGSKAPGPSALGECGRHSVYVYCYIRCIKYWLKILALPNDSIVKSCYLMMRNYCNNGRTNWASEVKKLLYRYGFGYAWDNQENLENDVFLDEFKTRVFDNDKQVWSASMSNMPKLRTLVLFKSNLSVENYLLLHIPRRLRVALAKFRVGNHDLEIEKGRYVKVPVDERFCKLCLTLNENHIEDEYHVLLKCPFYEDLRKIYLCFNNDPLNLHTFINIMYTQNQEEIVQLACFVSSMFKLRYYYLQSV